MEADNADDGEQMDVDGKQDEPEVRLLAELRPKHLWKVHFTEDNRRYYWNVATRETSWELPEGCLVST